MVDLYRQYGRAALAAASVEQKLTLLIAMVKSSGQSDDVFSAEHRKLVRKTLGPLLREASSFDCFDEDSAKFLRSILKYRNWMIHEIARDTLGFIVQKNGLKTLEGILADLTEYFESASELINQHIKKHLTQKGISQLYLENLIKNALSAEIEPNKAN